jgi:hypothetical protein
MKPTNGGFNAVASCPDSFVSFVPLWCKPSSCQLCFGLHVSNWSTPKIMLTVSLSSESGMEISR